jgi:hypothetical protein
MKNNVTTLLLLILFVTGGTSPAAEDLKTYYERQKQEIAPFFEPPRLGSEITFQLASGQHRTGILMKLDAGSILVMMDGRTVPYIRMALQESSRAEFFTEDYAHAKALEMTRMYKQQLQTEQRAAEAAGIHRGSLRVSAGTDKDTNKTVESEESKNKQGRMITQETETRTYSQVQKLQIEIDNSTTHPDTYTLDWYFFCESVNEGKKQAGKGGKGSDSQGEDERIQVHQKGSQKIEVDSRSRRTVNISSEAFIVEKIELSYDESRRNKNPKVSGKENAGWLVVLKYGGEVLDKKASAKSYLDEGFVAGLR